MADLFQWIYDLALSKTVRESLWVFPVLECIHIYSMIFLVTIIGAVDLRLLGFGIGDQPLSQLARRVLGWAWLCLGVNAATGLLLFASSAPDYSINSAFQIKILLIVLAMAFHTVVLRRAGRWDDVPAMPAGAKLTGCLSLALWIGVIAASRWIAFV